ncbi:futalosine hydrolase [Streptomyces sp. CC77]|nr:futalosine hydrolase [Streptomyces sp. CC77]
MRVLVVTAVAAEGAAGGRGLLGCGARSSRPLPGGHTVTSHLLTGLRPAPAADRADGAQGGPVSAPVADLRRPDASARDGRAGGEPAASPAARTAGDASVPGGHRASDPAADSVPGTPAAESSAGIGGGFAPHAPVGTLVLSDAIVAADLGADTPDGYLPVEQLGFGRSVHVPPPALTTRLAAALRTAGNRCLVAPVLTVSTVTGTADRAAELAARHPRAGAEAMEGFGVAEAAAAHGVPVVELRAVSNPVGPRDRAAWRIPEALDALRAAFEPLSTTVFVED